jgi:CRP-like cAMP-binding protein
MNKSNRLISQIESIISLNEAEKAMLFEAFEFKTLHKKDCFLKEGEICDFIGFITNGALIYSKTIANGNEITIDFAFENDWVTINESRLKNTPSAINIIAIEQTELLIIKQAVLNNLYYKIPKIERLGRILIEQSYLKLAQQSVALQLLTATQRYESLLLHYPEIFQKVPLYHIANYLGIAPKSLSRIRTEIFNK